MIQDVASFINYFEGVRKRTVHFIQTCPEDRLDWSPKPGEFTIADIILHLAAAEEMFVNVVLEGMWRYPDHKVMQDSDIIELLEDFNRRHINTMKALKGMPEPWLTQPRPTPKSHPMKAWRFLMLMVEHEVHHRSQLAVYLSLLNIKPPHIFGLGVEDLIQLTT